MGGILEIAERATATWSFHGCPDRVRRVRIGRVADIIISFCTCCKSTSYIRKNVYVRWNDQYCTGMYTHVSMC
jgi:hypothetical protein